MKEIEAYIPCNKASEVIFALEEAGYKGITMIDIMSKGSDGELNDCEYSSQCLEKYTKVAKLEIICVDKDLDKFVAVILRHGQIGIKDNVVVCVSEVVRTVKIRTGEGRNAAL